MRCAALVSLSPWIITHSVLLGWVVGVWLESQPITVCLLVVALFLIFLSGVVVVVVRTTFAPAHRTYAAACGLTHAVGFSILSFFGDWSAWFVAETWTLVLFIVLLDWDTLHAGVAACCDRRFLTATEPRTCPICLEEGDGMVRTRCDHVFHTTCIRSWWATERRAARQATCPVCRRSATLALVAWGTKVVPSTAGRA